MILRFGSHEFAIPLDTTFAPKAVQVCRTDASSGVGNRCRMRQSHARKLREAKRHLWKHSIPTWSKWKGC